MRKPSGPEISGNFDARKVITPVTSEPVLLTIAGFDPSSGAGITADIKTFASHNFYGCSCITALTVQSTKGVRKVEPLPGALVGETLRCVAEDISLAGIKIGMLGNGDVLCEVIAFLKSQSLERRRVVLDPVLRSSSGAQLLDLEGIRLLRERLLPEVGYVTPNLAELAVLAGTPPLSRDEIPQAALRLREVAERLGNAELNILVTGGHLDKPDDYLLSSSGDGIWISGERIVTRATHGTGCALSSALLCRVIAGDSPAQAARTAKEYVENAMRAAYPIGGGNGPLYHLFPRGG